MLYKVSPSYKINLCINFMEIKMCDHHTENNYNNNIIMNHKPKRKKKSKWQRFCKGIGRLLGTAAKSFICV